MRTRRTRRQAFNLVELLIVIIIIGALMAVAVPSLLNSRDSAGNSAAQQQLTSATTEIQTAMLRSNAVPATLVELQKVTPQIELISGGQAAGKVTGTGSALQVSTELTGAKIYLAAKGADGICWAVMVSLREKSYGKFGTAGTPTDCKATTASSGSGVTWNAFGFPSE